MKLVKQCSVISFKVIIKLALLCPLICLSARIQYQVSGDNLHEEVSVTICQTDTFYRNFESSLSDAVRYIKAHSNNVYIDRGRIKLKDTTSNCFTLIIDSKTYSVQSQKNSSSFNRYNSAKIVKLDTGLYFWRPVIQSDNTRYSLKLELPAGLSAALPWPKNNAEEYLLNSSPSFMSLHSYFGEFENIWVPVGTSGLRVAFLTELPIENQSKITRWLKTVSRALMTTYKGTPFDQLQIIITDIDRKTSSATPFAMVYRGEGALIHFLVNSYADESAFINDWTAYHEFSHLLLPFIDRRDAWVSEGFASYQQYLVMCRVGVINEAEAFRRFWSGIQRGLQNHTSTRKLSLAAASKHMRKYKSYRRVYWSGALIWLEADIILRQQNTSLLKVLREFNNCCASRHSIWSADQLANALDQLLKEPVFTPLFDSAKQSLEFPDYKGAFSKLGINVNGKRLTFKQSPIRQSIMATP